MIFVYNSFGINWKICGYIIIESYQLHSNEIVEGQFYGSANYGHFYK
jgi:hypothetical protein